MSLASRFCVQNKPCAMSPSPLLSFLPIARRADSRLLCMCWASWRVGEQSRHPSVVCKSWAGKRIESIIIINNWWEWSISSRAPLAVKIADRHPRQEQACMLLGPLQHFAGFCLCERLLTTPCQDGRDCQPKFLKQH